MLPTGRGCLEIRQPGAGRRHAGLLIRKRRADHILRLAAGPLPTSPGRRSEPPAPNHGRPPHHTYARRRISARASASAVRARSASRLSCSFLPLATASSHLMRPFFR